MITLSVSTLCFDSFDDTDFRRTFELAPQIGYRNIEFTFFHAHTLTRRGVAGVRNRCKETGLVPASFYATKIGGGERDELTKDLCHKMRVAEAARELGCSLICATSAPRGEYGGLDGVLTILDLILPFCEEIGVTLALENHAGFNLENIADFRSVFDRFDSPNLGLCVDVGHFHAAGVPLDEIDREFGSRITHIHLKDNRQFGTQEFVPFGEGTADNRGFLEMMDARGYDGYAVVEFSPFSVKMDDPTVHRKALSDARAMFGRYGE